MLRLQDRLGTGAFAILLTAFAGVSPTAAKPAVERVHLVDLEVRPMVDDAPAEPFSLSFSEEEDGRLTFRVDWPEPGRLVEVELRASGLPAGPDQTSRVEIDARVTLADGRKVQASRKASFRDRTTLLFEVYRQGGRPLTLAINASTRSAVVARTAPRVGRPVVLKLEIQRVEGDRRVSLETNELSTFERQWVSYEFRLGSTAESAALTVRLRPLRVVDEIVELEVDVSGRLPDGDGVMVIGQRKSLIASRGASSDLLVTSGDPPAGYRFVITPQF